MKETLESLPPVWHEDVLPLIRDIISKDTGRIFILDDDPTGSQTVEDVSLLTNWTMENLLSEFNSKESATFLLTNTRAKPAQEAMRVNKDIGSLLKTVAENCGRPISVISRCDSTLRGHFPKEVDALSEAIGLNYDGLLFVPFFSEGGRYTIDDVQYVSDGLYLIPASETPFANDNAFGYISSNLCEWIEEKTEGRTKASDVESVSIKDIREGGPIKVADILTGLSNSRPCVINAADMRDLDVVALAMLRCEADGKRFLIRSAASFVRSRIGQGDHELLTREQITQSDDGGALIIVGSHVPGSTKQLEVLLELPEMNAVELNVRNVIEGGTNLLADVVMEVDRCLSSGENVVVYTSRDLVTGSDSDEYLEIGTKVTDAISEVVLNLSERPRYMISKGGMTSSNVLMNGLNVSRATVPGQVFPGVLVLKMGSESKYPDTSLVLFPGNVGGPNAMADVVNRLAPPLCVRS